MSPPTMERPAPTKKSLRIWVRNNGHMTRNEKRFTYVYPRTVEAAKDPFVCSSGKNKMFFLIAINVFPDSKIIRPDTSDSEAEAEETVEKEKTYAAQTQTDSQRQRFQQRRALRRKSMKKYAMKKRLQRVTKSLKPHNPETQPDCVGNFENASQNKTPFGAGSRKRPRSGKARVKRVTNENETECSRLLQDDPRLSQTVPDVATPTKTNSPKDNSRKKLPAIPSILSSFHKVIQNCSDTGLVSFDISKKPRQSRS